MYFKFKDAVKVDKSVESIHYMARKKPKLVLGGTYYFSFGSHIAAPCKLVHIFEERGKVDIEATRIMDKKESQITYCLFWDEIGLTPEEAVINTVTG